MNSIFIVISRSCCGTEKESSKTFPNAFATRDGAFGAVADDIARALHDGAIKEGSTIVPAPVASPDGGWRFTEDDIRRFDAVSIFRPCAGDPLWGSLQEQVGRYDICRMSLEDANLVSQKKERLYEGGRRLLKVLCDGGHDSFRPLACTACLHHWTDSNGTVWESSFITEELYHNGAVPMARGRWEGGEEDTVALTDEEVCDGPVLETYWWIDDDLKDLADGLAPES